MVHLEKSEEEIIIGTKKSPTKEVMTRVTTCSLS